MAAAQGHPVVMSNYGNFYLDYPAHSAEKMWFDIRGTNSNATQTALLLGGEVSMWQDQYVGSCIFGSDKDANFSASASQCIWPRTAIAAGSFWGYYDDTIGTAAQRAKFNATFDAVQARLASRNVSSCGCATLTSNGCSQMKSCTAYYCPPKPPPPPSPPLLGCFNYSSVNGFACVDTASGQAGLAIWSGAVECKSMRTGHKDEDEDALSSCSAAAAILCAKHAGCDIFAIVLSAADLKAGKAQVDFFKRGTAPAPTPSTKLTFAVPCDPEDTNQRFSYDKTSRQITHSGAGGSLCVTAPGGCKGVEQLALTPCAALSTVSGSLQQWEHTQEASFTPSSCVGTHCIDLYGGGKSQNAGLYSCSHTWNQVWRPAFTGAPQGQGTFEEPTDGKCLSSAGPAPTRASLITSAGHIAFMKT
jgi:hypothetical protein